MHRATGTIQSIDTEGNRIQDPIKYEGAVSGRFYLERWFRMPDRANFLPSCVASIMTPDRLVVTCDVSGTPGERAFAHFREIGLVRGVVSRVIGARFTLDVDTDQNHRNKIASSILWLERKARFNLADKRLFPRFQPKESRSSLRVGSTSPMACHVINVSPTGAAVMSEFRPELRERVELGQIPGDVVRHTDFGFAMQFVQVQDPAYLEDLLAAEPVVDPSAMPLQQVQIVNDPKG